MTGDAFTFVAPNEEGDLRAIERALGRRLPRVTVPGFDYTARPTTRLEVPIAERIAGIRARKKEERTRAAERTARRKSAGASGDKSGGPRGAKSGGRGPQRSGRRGRR